jgi:hypothetical protein
MHGGCHKEHEINYPREMAFSEFSDFGIFAVFCRSMLTVYSYLRSEYITGPDFLCKKVSKPGP